MQNDPLNQLPIDPEWVKLADRLTAEAAQQLRGMVLLMIIQPGGKMGLQIDGVPPSGPLHEMAQDLPAFLETMASVLRFADSRDAATPKADKH